MINIPINSQAVNDAIAQAVLTSSLGETIKTVIQKNLQSLIRWDGVVEVTVKEVIKAYVEDLIKNDYAEQIRNEVRMFLTKEHIREFLGKILERIMRQI